ncbi:MAG: hypothetical protein ABFS34_16465, partial [Gemmatimonadota bacterium]
MLRITTSTGAAAPPRPDGPPSTEGSTLGFRTLAGTGSKLGGAGGVTGAGDGVMGAGDGVMGAG